MLHHLFNTVFYKKHVLIIGALLFVQPLMAQPSNGQLRSLLDTEHYFAATAQHKGLRKAFLRVIDAESLIFNPGPVKALPYYWGMRNEPSFKLSWEPVFARIAKSGDWGFTSGPFQKVYPDGKITYGQYVSVWRTDSKGIWKLDLDLGVTQPQPETEMPLDFKEPPSNRFFRQNSAKRLEEREDVVMMTDRLLTTAVLSKGTTAYRGFLAEDIRLLLPGQQPLVGIEAVQRFWETHPAIIKSVPEAVDRALSGDWAYTRGTANLTLDDQTRQYNYVRIWQLQQGFNWNLVLEIFSPLAD